jgi:hypothetical protein
LATARSFPGRTGLASWLLLNLPAGVKTRTDPGSFGFVIDCRTKPNTNHEITKIRKGEKDKGMARVGRDKEMGNPGNSLSRKLLAFVLSSFRLFVIRIDLYSTRADSLM